MKKTAFILLTFALMLTSCSKKSPSPEGPTDIRIKNDTEAEYLNVVVNTGEETHTYGTVAAHSVSDYFRFEKAYPDSEITLTIGDVEYTTGVPDNTYAVWLGQGKFSYEVWVSVPDDHLLDMRVIPEAPLDK